MSERLKAVVTFAALIFSTTVLAQSGTTLSGVVPRWQEGEADIVLLPPRHVPPPFTRPSDSLQIGTVAEDGTFTITLPESLPREEFVPVARFLDPGCAELSLEPAEAAYFPITFGVYDAGGALIGELFRGSTGAEQGPIPGEYTTLPGYAEQGFTLRGSCPDPRRPVVEEYDVSVEAGWHELVQTFTEHPEKTGWRIDRWRNEPVPEQAVWLLIGPPR